MKWIFGASILAMTLGFAATGTIPATTITPDESMLKYFPSETQSIAFVDVAALRSTPLVQGFLKEGKFQSLPPGVNEFIDATGFDVRRDLDRVAVGTISAREKLVVAEARYDKFKAEQYVRDKGGQPETYLGRPVYRRSEGAVTFLDGVVLFGTEGAVRQGIDRTTYPGGMQISKDLLDAMRAIEAGSQIWSVGNALPVDVGVAGLERTPFVQIVKSLKGGSYQVRIDTDIHARAIADFTDANTATNLADMARGFIAMAKLQVAQQQPDMVHILDGIQVSSNGSSVIAHIEEPGDLISRGFSGFKGFKGRIR